MKDRLYELLGEISEIETEISCMVQILESLKVVYDIDNHFEIRSCIEMCSQWGKSLESNVAAVGSELDKILISENIG